MAFVRGVLAASLATAASSCGGGDGLLRPEDGIPPEVRILVPAQGSTVTTARPSFLIEVTDVGTGVFCSTVEATLEGTDVSNFFLNGCDAETGEIRVNAPLAVEDGATRLTLRISDHAGNRTSAAVTFLVNTVPRPPSPE